MDDPTPAEPALPDDEAFLEIRRLTRVGSLAQVEPLRALLAEAEAKSQPVHRAFALAGLAMAYGTTDPETALRLARMAVPQMEALGTRVGMCTALTSLGLVHRTRGELTESLVALERVLELQRQLGDAREQAKTLANLSITLESLGRRETRLQCLEEAQSLLAVHKGGLELAVKNNLIVALGDDAWHDRDAGLPEAQWRPRAERAARMARELLAEPQDRLRQQLQNPNYARGALARALVVLDELDEALPLLEELQEIYTAAENNYALLFVQRERMRAWLQSGQPAQVRDLAPQAIALATERHFENFLPELWLLLSRAHEALGEWQPALVAFQTYHRLKLHAAMQVAEDRARSLAVRLDTHRAQRESRLDALTGLLNRRGFDEAFASALQQASQALPLTLMLIDLDHFKAVNDRRGHAHGDQALALVGQQLQQLGRPQDEAARLGGDEFAWFGLLLPEQAVQVAERLRQRLREASLARWPDLPPLTLSIGIADARQDTAASEVMNRADAALYAVKAAGRDGVHRD